MSTESTPTNSHLASLRIARRAEAAGSARRRFATPVVVVGVCVVLAGAALVSYSKTNVRSVPVETIVVERIQRHPPSAILNGSGYIVTRHKYITIGTKILGQIVDEPIEEGQRVRKGDILARIDDRDYQAQLRQAIAIRDLAKANVRLSEARAERARRLHGTGAISTDDFETAINAVEVAQAELERDEASVDYAKFNANQCVINSPINGIVLKKFREVGDTINFGGQIQAGGGATDIAQLADTDNIRAEVDTNEADIARIAASSPATVVLDSHPGRSFVAAVVKIYPEADRQKGTVKVEVQLERPDLQIIRPEMSVKVSFLEKHPETNEEPRLNVPKRAIESDGKTFFVWVVKNGAATRVAIQRGRENETEVEVRQGLNDGDHVVVASKSALHEGQKITTEPSRANSFGK